MGEGCEGCGPQAELTKPRERPQAGHQYHQRGDRYIPKGDPFSDRLRAARRTNLLKVAAHFSPRSMGVLRTTINLAVLNWATLTDPSPNRHIRFQNHCE
jgi:hypothetical protein